MTAFVLVLGVAGGVYWLSSSYDPNLELAIPTVQAELPPRPGEAPSDDGAEQPVESASATPRASPPPRGAAASPPGAPAGAPAPAPQPSAQAAAETAPADAGTSDAESEAAPVTKAEAAPAPVSETTSSDATTAAATPKEAAPAAAAPANADPAPAETGPIALAPAPDPALVRSTAQGPLPIVGPDGRTPLQAYARPHGETGRPRVAVVLGSLGLSRPATIAAIQQLPGGVTLAFAPYGRDLQAYADQARAAGHEVLLQVPMEPVDYPSHDPGPHTLLTSLPARKNIERLDWLLGRFAGYVGVVNYMGSRFTASEPHLRPVLVSLRDRGLMFVDARATAASVVMQTAVEIGLPAVSNDRYIDNEASRRNIDARLQELERLARARGQATGLAFPYPVTIERLSQWSRGLPAKGIELAPVSALLVQQKLPG